MAISFSGYAFLIIICIFLPLRNFQALRKTPIGRPIVTPKAKRYRVGITSTMIQTALAFLVGLDNGVPLFGSFRPDLQAIFATLAFLVITLGTLPGLVKLRSPEWRMRFYSLLPETAGERTAWVFICVIVAVGEEVLYRAVLWMLLYRLTGDYWIAAALAAMVFAINHLMQGWISVGTIFIVGVGFHLLVFISGGLYAAIAAHFVYDLCAGLCFGNLAKKESRGLETVRDAASTT